MRTVDQPSLPLGRVSPDEIARKRTFGDAIALSAEVAGYDLDKQASAELEMDKAQWSRIQSGKEGIKWERLQRFIARMGNDIPVLWMLHQLGYDLLSLRKRETETERKLRLALERIELLEHDKRVLSEALRGQT